MPSIEFRGGFKYQLAARYAVQCGVKTRTRFDVQIGVKPAARIITKYLTLDPDGTLTIEAGYAWDGPSGPTIDTLNFMRGSLVHDALYQLMRMELLSQGCRAAADDALRRICREDGMSAWRAWYVWRSVRRLAAGAAEAGTAKPILTAP